MLGTIVATVQAIEMSAGAWKNSTINPIPKDIRELNKKNIQYSLRRARPLKLEYFLMTSINQFIMITPMLKFIFDRIILNNLERNW